MYFIGQLVGAFIITFLLSRVMLRIFKPWLDGTKRLAAAHGSVLAFSWVVSAFGAADGGSPKWGYGAIYVLPVCVWFLVDLSRDRENPDEALHEPSEPPVIRKGRDISN